LSDTVTAGVAIAVASSWAN